MLKHFTKEYFLFLFYRALSLGFMVVSLDYFLSKSGFGGTALNIVFLLLSLFFSVISSKLKPKLSLCLEGLGFFSSFFISLGITLSFMGVVLLFVHMQNGEEVMLKYFLYVIFISIIASTAYFWQCRKKDIQMPRLD